MLYDKHGRQGLLDAEDVGISLDGVRLPTTTPPRLGSRPITGLASFRDPNDVFYEFFGCREPLKGAVLHDGGSYVIQFHSANQTFFASVFLSLSFLPLSTLSPLFPAPGSGPSNSAEGLGGPVERTAFAANAIG